MLYCTKCGREYENTQKLCPECGSILVEKATDEDSENHIPVACESQETASRIEAFFRYSGLKEVFLSYDDSSDSFRVLVNESDYPVAVKLLNTFNLEEEKKQFELEADAKTIEQQAKSERLLLNQTSNVYVKSSDRYQNVRSSAFSLIIIGSVLLIAEILDLCNILNLNLNIVSEIMMQIIFVGMGLGFLIGGIVSLRKASSIKTDIQEENELTEEVIEWFTHTYTAADLDHDIDDSLEEGSTLGETERQLRRLELIKAYINNDYDIPDDSFVDALSETLYQKLYENS